MATHSSVLAWRIPGTGEPGGLPSMGSHRVGHDWSDLAAEGGKNCISTIATAFCCCIVWHGIVGNIVPWHPVSVCFPSGSISTSPGSHIGYSDVCSRLDLQSNCCLGSYSYAYLLSPSITTIRVWRVGHHWATELNWTEGLKAEKAMAPHSSTLAWKIPWMEEPGRLQSMGSLRVGHDWATSLSLFAFLRWRRKWQPTPMFLPGESQGRGSLVGCRLWGRTESDTTEAT